MIKEFYWHYIAYEDLKAALKTDYEFDPNSGNPTSRRKPWTEENERQFVALLESELDKVFTFQKLKSDEIVRRIKASEQEVNEVVDRLNSFREQQQQREQSQQQLLQRPSDASRPRQSSNAQQPTTDEDFLLLEEDLSDIIADVHDLAKYTRLNYTGFQKIIKKHDVRDIRIVSHVSLYGNEYVN